VAVCIRYHSSSGNETVETPYPQFNYTHKCKRHYEHDDYPYCDIPVWIRAMVRIDKPRKAKINMGGKKVTIWASWWGRNVYRCKGWHLGGLPSKPVVGWNKSNKKKWPEPKFVWYEIKPDVNRAYKSSEEIVYIPKELNWKGWGYSGTLPEGTHRYRVKVLSPIKKADEPPSTPGGAQALRISVRGEV